MCAPATTNRFGGTHDSPSPSGLPGGGGFGGSFGVVVIIIVVGNPSVSTLNLPVHPRGVVCRSWSSATLLGRV